MTYQEITSELLAAFNAGDKSRVAELQGRMPDVLAEKAREMARRYNLGDGEELGRIASLAQFIRDAETATPTPNRNTALSHLARIEMEVILAPWQDVTVEDVLEFMDVREIDETIERLEGAHERMVERNAVMRVGNYDFLLDLAFHARLQLQARRQLLTA